MTTATPRSRGEYAKSAARRQEIVQAAVEVFCGAGYHKGSLRDVAERVGMSQAGVLHHFPSKHHLLEAVLAWRDDQSLAFLGGSVPEGLDMIRGLVEIVRRNETTPELVELHVLLTAEGTAPDHPMHDYFVNRYKWLTDNLTAAFGLMAERGQLRPGVDGASTARSLTALMDGLQLQWLCDRTSVDMAEEVRRYLRPLLAVEL